MAESYFPGTQVTTDSPGIRTMHSSHFPDGNTNASLENPTVISPTGIDVSIIATLPLSEGSPLVLAMPDRSEPMNHTDVSAYGRILVEAAKNDLASKAANYVNPSQAPEKPKINLELDYAHGELNGSPHKVQYEKLISDTSTEVLSNYNERVTDLVSGLKPAKEGAQVKIVDGYTFPDGRYVYLANRAHGVWKNKDLKIPESLDDHVLVIGSPFNDDPLTVAEQFGRANVQIYRGSGTYFVGGTFATQLENGQKSIISIDLANFDDNNSFQFNDEEPIVNVMSTREIDLLVENK